VTDKDDAYLALAWGSMQNLIRQIKIGKALVQVRANLCPLSIVVSGEWGIGALGRWGKSENAPTKRDLLPVLLEG